MAIGNINPGYKGIAEIDGSQFRFESASISVKQEIETRELVMGDWDRDAYVYGKATVEGDISGPMTETFVASDGLLEKACKRSGDCGVLDPMEIELWYYCDRGSTPAGNAGNHRTFNGMLVNSLSLNVSAGDVANFSASFMGTGASDWSDSTPSSFTTAEKLITWDKCSVAISSGGSDAPASTVAFESFELRIENNLEAKYAIGSSMDLFPYDIVPMLRSVSGSLTAYNIPDANGFDTWDDYNASDISTITFTFGTLSIATKVRFHRVDPSLQVGAITSIIGFTGVGHQTGNPWV